jgi:hypothetical protein
MASAVLFEYVSSAPRTRVRGHFERVVLEKDVLLLMEGNAADVAGEEALRRAVRDRLAEDERCRAREADAMREEERRQRAFDKNKRQRLGMAAASQPLSVGKVDLRTADAQVFDAQAAMERFLGCGKVFVTSGADCVEHAPSPSGSARDVEEEHAASLSGSTSHAEWV